MVLNSIYRPIFVRHEIKLYKGFDYKDKILKRTLSNNMFNVNPTLDLFLTKIDNIVYEWVESVKQIKVFGNIALSKYDRNIN